jgi:hypothetical protein
MNQELIEKARRGEIAVHNVDCTVEELNKVLDAIWPNDPTGGSVGKFTFYFNGTIDGEIVWLCDDSMEYTGCRKSFPVRNFLTEKPTEQ